MNLHVMLNEISQSQQDKLYEEVRIVKFIDTESRMIVAGAQRKGELFNGDKVSVLQDEKRSGDGCWW